MQYLFHKTLTKIKWESVDWEFYSLALMLSSKQTRSAIIYIFIYICVYIFYFGRKVDS